MMATETLRKTKLTLRVVGLYLLVLVIYHGCGLAVPMAPPAASSTTSPVAKATTTTQVRNVAEIILHLPAVGGYMGLEQTVKFCKFVHHSIRNWRESLAAIYQGILSFFNLLFESLKSPVLNLLEYIFYRPLKWLFDSIINIFTGVARWLYETFAEPFVKLYNWICNFVRWLYNGIVNVLTDFFTAIGQWLYDTFADPLVRFYNWLTSSAKWLCGIVVDAFWAGANFFYDLVERILTALWTGIKDVCSTIWNLVKRTCSAIWDILPSFSMVMKNLYWGIEWCLTQVYSLLYNLFSWLFNGIKGILIACRDFFRDNYDRICAAFRRCYNFLAWFFGGVWSWVVWFFSGIWKIISSVVRGIWSIISGCYTAIVYLGELFFGVWTSVVEMVAKVYSAIINFLLLPWKFVLVIRGFLYTTAYSFYVSCSNVVYEIYALITNAISGIYLSCINAVWSIYSAVTIAAYSTYMSMTNYFSEKVWAIYNSVSTACFKVLEKFSNFGYGILEKIQHGAYTIYNKFF